MPSKQLKDDTPTGLGLILDDSLLVKDVHPDGASQGILKEGDCITHVNETSVLGKGKDTVSKMIQSSSNVILGIQRGGSKLDVLVRIPIHRQHLTPDLIREQLKLGNRRRTDDTFVEAVFQRHADLPGMLHIPRKNLCAALDELELKISEDLVDEYFRDRDLDGDGLIDFDEFKEALPLVLMPLNIRNLIHSFGRADSNGEIHIPTENYQSTIQELIKLGDDDAIDFFEAAACSSGSKPERFTLSMRSKEGRLPPEQRIREVFERHAVKAECKYMPKNKLSRALKAVGLELTQDVLSHFIRTINLNHNGFIHLEEFKELVKSASPLEVWTNSLPLGKLLADALPKHTSCNHLRVVSSLTKKEIELVAAEYSNALKDLLTEHISKLKSAFRAMDQKFVARDNQFAPKFKVEKMVGGTIDDFHAGLNERIGPCRLDFYRAMEEEHCSGDVADKTFETKNYNIKTTPRTEWNIVTKNITPENMSNGRKIPNVEDLLKIEISIKANLDVSEVTSMVLYTGPMHHVYNTILRRQPAKEFEIFKKSDNLFSTTIHALVSAVLKLCRAVQLPKGLVLYRGLGGTLDFPDAFYKTDRNGCQGFADWGFLSTTSDKQVAIDYSGMKEDKPLPIVLAIRVGAVDRGASIVPFSQYEREHEYLYVPCSFLEQDGPQQLEIQSAGIAAIIPVKVNANVKALTLDEIIVQKKNLHLDAFQCLIREIQRKLLTLADEHTAEERLKEDSSKEEGKHTVDGFIARIMEQCKEVFQRHKAKSVEEYSASHSYRSLVLEMVDAKTMAISKFQEWLFNKSSSFIRYRYTAKLKTVHRRWIAYLERQRISTPNGKLKSLSIQLCKEKGLCVNSIDEVNELDESILMAAAAEGWSADQLRLLVDAGSDVNASRPDGVTAVWLAAQFGHKDCIRVLHELKANISQAANDGATPVYIAAQAGNVECIELLADLNANVTTPDKKGQTPLDQAAYNGHCGTIKMLQKKGAIDVEMPAKLIETARNTALSSNHLEAAELLASMGPSSPCENRQKKSSNHFEAGESLASTGPSSPCENRQRTLIVSSGDISDVDGFFALRQYAKTQADVLFVLNYPAYIGVNEADPNYSEMNPGMGYKYSAKEVWERYREGMSKEVDDFLSKYDSNDFNDRVKRALTDTAFALAKRVWDEVPSHGRLLFCIGGINKINPFSQKAIKNEILVYADLMTDDTPRLDPKQGSIYCAENAKPCEILWSEYREIYMDFNGSMAYLDESWLDTLGKRTIVEKIKGVFVMGGVYENAAPITSPSIRDVLNRFSSATINQLHHPQKAADFFAFVSAYAIPTFIVANNAVHDLTTYEEDGRSLKNFTGLDQFVLSNGLDGDFLKNIMTRHYSSLKFHARKAYDFYVSLALTAMLENRPDASALTTSRKRLYYSNVYGITVVSNCDSWEDTRTSYISNINTIVLDEDTVEVKDRKKIFEREISLMKQIKDLTFIEVYDVSFSLHADSKLLQIVPRNSCA